MDNKTDNKTVNIDIKDVASAFKKEVTTLDEIKAVVASTSDAIGLSFANPETRIAFFDSVAKQLHESGLSTQIAERTIIKINQALADSVSQIVFNMTATTARSKNICVCCKATVDTEKLSMAEKNGYTITALCPTCAKVMEGKNERD